MRNPAIPFAGETPNATALSRNRLAGERGAPRDIVLINSALALIAAEKASQFREAAALAAESIDSGAASRKLDQLRAAAST